MKFTGLEAVLSEMWALVKDYLDACKLYSTNSVNGKEYKCLGRKFHEVRSALLCSHAMTFHRLLLSLYIYASQCTRHALGNCSDDIGFYMCQAEP